MNNGRPDLNGALDSEEFIKYSPVWELDLLSREWPFAEV